MPYSSLAPSFLSYFNPTYFISIMAHLYSLFDLYIPYGNFNFTLVLVLKFPGSLNLSFHNLSIHQFSRKNLSLAQFIPRIYNKIIIKILGYFWGVTELLVGAAMTEVNQVLGSLLTVSTRRVELTTSEAMVSERVSMLAKSRSEGGAKTRVSQNL